MQRRMLGKGGTVVIPTPEAGVCTVYPIAIPVTTNIYGYYSCFNSCDLNENNDGTGAIDVTGELNAYYGDISSNSNPMISTDALGGKVRGSEYIDNGSGDVYWEGKTSPDTQMTPDSSLEFGNTIKTMLFLCRTSDVTNTTLTRLGPHLQSFQGYLRYNAGKLEMVGDGSMTAALGIDNTWQVISARADGNVVLGVDKSYEEVFASPPGHTGSNFNIWTPGSGRWDGDIREIAFYSESLSDGDVDTMVDYMKDKWQLP